MSISAASTRGRFNIYFFILFFISLFFCFGSTLIVTYITTQTTHTMLICLQTSFFSPFFGRKLVLSSSTSFFISAIAGLTYRVKHPFTLTFNHTYGQFTVTNYTNSLLSFWTRGGSQYLLATINTPLGYMFPWQGITVVNTVYLYTN